MPSYAVAVPWPGASSCALPCRPGLCASAAVLCVRLADLVVTSCNVPHHRRYRGCRLPRSCNPRQRARDRSRPPWSLFPADSSSGRLTTRYVYYSLTSSSSSLPLLYPRTSSANPSALQTPRTSRSTSRTSRSMSRTSRSTFWTSRSPSRRRGRRLGAVIDVAVTVDKPLGARCLGRRVRRRCTNSASRSTSRRYLVRILYVSCTYLVRTRRRGRRLVVIVVVTGGPRGPRHRRCNVGPRTPALSPSSL